ncbi:MAG: T9SS type A sorting domain-containing protein [Flavobacteriales bacterium]
MSVRSSVLVLAAALSATLPLVHAQRVLQNAEVTYIADIQRVPDRELQQELRHRAPWTAFKAQHPKWSVEFNEYSGMPQRAYGDPIAVQGATVEEKAMNFLGTGTASFRLPMEDLVPLATAPTGKLTYVHFSQVHAGLPVIGASAMVKFDAQGRVIAFGADVHKNFELDMVPTLAEAAVEGVAAQGLSNVLTTEHQGLGLLPVPQGATIDMRLVRQLTVHTLSGERPGQYRCLVDAHTGKLWYRSDAVVFCDHGVDDDAGADVQMNATAYAGSPLQAPAVQGLPDLDVTVGGTLFRTDETGSLLSGVAGPVPAQYQLRGRWSNVSTNGVTPTFTGTLNEGVNTVSFDANSNIRERSAYIYTNQIHAHAKAVLPGFTGMDFSLATRVDLTTDNCNAFYDGSSINFYAEGNNCRSLATINDVVYHEYGHGINDKFYLSLASNFTNGAMNEGYADVWGFTLTQNPVLGLGMNLDNDNSNVRQYDAAPKVYPVDIVGEVHADGEIIAGAWWDTYLLLGNDMELTLDLFADAYPGLQANTANGNEGQAFRNVLLDVLQADDDDGDITNGTPNGGAIVEAFGIHGITLISDAELIHDGLLSALEFEPVQVDVDVIITFPSTEYLEGVYMYYRMNGDDDWVELPMTSDDGSSYSASVPAQPAGTVMAYYVSLKDIFGQVSSVTPVGAERLDPNIPFYALIGYQLVATENADNLNELGFWVEGQPTDNATTGNWEFGAPVPSYSDILDPSTIVQTGTQHTPGGELCWFTGNATGPTAPLGENDVDGGTTTLMGPNIDLSGYDNPAISYWRWYTNNPPSGANPNADWWQVYASSDGGVNWVPVEDTKSGQRTWRRKVFRVRDVLGDVNSIQLKFHASDSIRDGQELNGGSLVEAALDDIELWDEVAGNSVVDVIAAPNVRLWPSPANGDLNVSIRDRAVAVARMEVLDMMGRVVLRPSTNPGATDVHRLDVRSLAEGQYVLRILWDGGSSEERFSIVR